MRLTSAAVLVAVSLVPAVFGPAARAEDAPKKGPEADSEFMVGIRKVGVMSGQAFACTPEGGERDAIGEQAIQLATQVALHFGLQVAFIYSGSFGYGTGHPFDKATCPDTLASFKALTDKYLGK